jgi:hypothetical protein
MPTPSMSRRPSCQEFLDFKAIMRFLDAPLSLLRGLLPFFFKQRHTGKRGTQMVPLWIHQGGS